MGRGRVQLRRIENKINRQVTFSKRRKGLMKKASELSILCDAEVALIVFSNKGKLYDFSSSSMTKILEKYKKVSNTIPNGSKDTQNSELELTKLKIKIEHLQRWERHMLGEDLDSMNLEELLQLENQLEEGLMHIRLRKEQLFEEINKSLHNKSIPCDDYGKQILHSLDVERQYPCELYPIQVLRAPWPSIAGNCRSGFSSSEVDTHDHSQPTEYMG